MGWVLWRMAGTATRGGSIDLLLFFWHPALVSVLNTLNEIVLLLTSIWFQQGSFHMFCNECHIYVFSYWANQKLKVEGLVWLSFQKLYPVSCIRDLKNERKKISVERGLCRFCASACWAVGYRDVRVIYLGEYRSILLSVHRSLSVCQGLLDTCQCILRERSSHVLTDTDMWQSGIRTCFSNVWKSTVFANSWQYPRQALWGPFKFIAGTVVTEVL